MTRLTHMALALLLLPAFVVRAQGTTESWDGLVEVAPKRMDAAYLLPGADFRPYTKLMVDPTEVAFSRDWMKSINQQTRDLSRRITDDEAAAILATTRENFDDVFGEAFARAGYQIVTRPGPDVMRVRTSIVNLHVNAPDPLSPGRTRTFTTNAGEATLVIEARDSLTGALLGRAIDRRETRHSAGLERTTSVTNVAEFRSLFRQWAGIATKGLEELKAHSPVPTDLKPRQKL